jgi:hypothetical protein
MNLEGSVIKYRDNFLADLNLRFDVIVLSMYVRLFPKKDN